MVTTYYIDDAGSDSNDGSSGSPWLTIDHAVGNATWAGADGLVFVLSGNFELTSQISPTNFNAYAIPVVFTAATQYGASVIHNHTTSGIIGNWAYRRTMWHNLDLIQKNSGALFTFHAHASDCRIDADASATGIFMFSNVKAVLTRCVIKNTSGNAKAINVSSGSALTDCDITGYRFLSFANDSDGGVVSRCRFLNCGEAIWSTLVLEAAATSYSQSAVISHNSFYGCGGDAGVINQTNGHQVYGNVFASNLNSGDCFVDTEPLFAVENNYYYDGSAGSPDMMGPGTTSLLSTAPYADPANGDWTPSAELSAIVGSDGLTPGAVQAAAGSSTFNPFLSRAFGAR